MKQCCCVEKCHCLHPIVFTSSAQATGYATTSTGDLVTATATASANSYISEADAFQNAYFTALQNANIEAQNSANIIDQTLEIVETDDLGIKGATGAQGATGLQGNQGAQGATGPGLSTINTYPVQQTTDPANYNMVLGTEVVNGTSNTGLGVDVLFNNTTGYDNVGTGYQALYSNTTGIYNVGTGYQALYSNTAGSYNVATGSGALNANTTGSTNVATGFSALFSNTTGSNNVATGLQALFSNTTGSSNVATGPQALFKNTTGEYNVGVGFEALNLNTTGENNVGVGRQALLNNTTGSNNTALGYLAGSTLNGNGTTTGLNNTFIGSGAPPYSATASNQIVLGTSTEQLNIQGGFSYSNAFISGDITLTFPLKQLYIVTPNNPSTVIDLPLMTNNDYYLGTLVQFRKTDTSFVGLVDVFASNSMIATGSSSIVASIRVPNNSTVTLVYAQYDTSLYAWIQL